MNPVTAYDALWNHLAVPEAFHAIEGEEHTTWLRTEDRRFLHLAPILAENHSARLSAVPRKYEGTLRYAAEESGALWARTETGKGLQLLEAFRPEPTLVIADEGTVRRTALWLLRHPLGIEWTERANRRLAHHLGSLKRTATRDFTFRLPVGEVAGSGELHEPQWVVGHLPDGPAPDAWALRQRIAELRAA